ncbi:damage-inducible mutagenesis protein [Asticcacaulis sp. AC460]|uniref:ImuA family protein n=1 Tax=Asticcacaulis sp. AC460 TaxID=1282360 RepID=UPI0003C3F66B|nr:damage-inducible mutagenesis protein [Asticcacaulis sp. AC460]ESQ87617.1 damage-inducible mutagenesis protein [Asticcacaulis sp. AC460]
MAKPAFENLEALRRHVQLLEGSRRAAGVLPFGIERIDARLPGGGLTLGALHEVAGRDQGVVDGAAAALFVAGIAARTKGHVLWCLTQADLFAPGLAQAGLDPQRVICVEAGDEKSVLLCCEEALRHGGLGAVVAEVSRLSLTASRRLQLAAENTRTLALALRRWGKVKEAAEFGLPTAAVTRWRIASARSHALPVAGIGTARWRLELLRCKGGDAAEFDVEARYGQAGLALSAPLADRSAAAAVAARRDGFRAAS